MRNVLRELELENQELRYRDKETEKTLDLINDYESDSDDEGWFRKSITALKKNKDGSYKLSLDNLSFEELYDISEGIFKSISFDSLPNNKVVVSKLREPVIHLFKIFNIDTNNIKFIKCHNTIPRSYTLRIPSLSFEQAKHIRNTIY